MFSPVHDLIGSNIHGAENNQSNVSFHALPKASEPKLSGYIITFMLNYGM